MAIDNSHIKDLNRNTTRSIKAETEAQEQGRAFSLIGWPLVVRGGHILKGDQEGVHWMQPTPFGYR